MAEYYGTLQGSRGRATRCGTKASGMKASAQSYDGSVIVDMGDGVVEISVAEGSNSGGGRTLFHGTMEELLALVAGKWRPTIRPGSELSWGHVTHADAPDYPVQHTAETCPGRPCGTGCNHKAVV